jgi:hypothetical protein
VREASDELAPFAIRPVPVEANIAVMVRVLGAGFVRLVLGDRAAAAQPAVGVDQVVREDTVQVLGLECGIGRQVAVRKRDTTIEIVVHAHVTPPTD